MKFDAHAIGFRIRQMRKRQNMTQEQLAELADISVVYVSKLEHGQRVSSLETLIDICNALNCSMDDLLKDHLTATSVPYPSQIETILSNATNTDREFLAHLLSALRNYL